MMQLPVIVGFGGFNSAGRSSFHQGFGRMVIESLPISQQREVLHGLSTMTGMARYDKGRYVNTENTQANEGETFDLDAATEQLKSATLIREFGLPPAPYSDAWYQKLKVSSAGALPSGFDPGRYYPSRFHPRGLQMAMMGVSDAIHSMGIPWLQVMNRILPDQVGVYASSGMAQCDDFGYRGLFQSRMQGRHVSAKQLPLGLNSMPTDFINAYVLGSVGSTTSATGACASFLYNLRLGVEDIQSGRRRVVIVGNSEAPLTQEIMDGYAVMGALATDAALCHLDQSGTPDHRRASRPFGENCGFTLAESSQFVVLMDDALAVELGAGIHGAVTDVFINADGYKHSISSPGAGNYITLAKAAASVRALLGDSVLQNASWVQSHGSSTPQNRVSESQILHRIAETFNIDQWPVTAVKSYVGHSLAAAGGDQLMATLGTFCHQLLPGIKTIERVADDVFSQRLQISNTDVGRDDESPLQVSLVNAKGFGGNNATAVVLSPQVVREMLQKRYGAPDWVSYQKAQEAVSRQAEEYHQRALCGDLAPRYQFGQGVLTDQDIHLTMDAITLEGFRHSIPLPTQSPYADMV
ncbi:MAG: beta-ketoacyl synthase [Hahellaceae bacterium]|nr:beta-ketoacyl synthase [Hahellaceae bacterium]